MYLFDESVQVLRRVAGEEADRFMEGHERIMGVKHEHSDAAYRMLERYAVDKCFQVVFFLIVIMLWDDCSAWL